MCESKSYDAFRRVDLHAIDATTARWRGDAGSAPLDGTSAATSPDTLVDFHTGEKSPEKPDPYAEDRRKQSMQLKKIQGYLHRAQTIVKEVRIQQVLFPVSLTRLDRVPTPSTDAPSPHAIAATRRRTAGPGEGGR